MSVIQIVASGSNQLDAYAINLFEQQCLDVATVPSGSGIRLPFSQSNSSILVANNGANSLSIYPPSNGTIDGGAVNAPISLASGSKVILYSIFSTGNARDWYSFTGGGSTPAMPAFLSFSITGQSTPIEVGATILAGAKTFVWSTSNSSSVSPNSISIVDTTASTTLATGLANTGSDSITISSITNTSPASQIWTINGNIVGGGTFSRTYTVNWEWKILAGTSTNVTLTGSQINALIDSSALQAGFAGTYNLSAGGYKYFCYPDSLGSVSNFVDANTGFPISMATVADNAAYSNTANGWSYALVSVTNAQSITTNYRVYRSQFILGGTLSMRVS